MSEGVIWLLVGFFFGSTIWSCVSSVVSLALTLTGFTFRLCMGILGGERGMDRFLERYGLDKRSLEEHRNRLNVERERLEKEAERLNVKTDRTNAETEKLRKENERIQEELRRVFQEKLRGTQEKTFRERLKDEEPTRRRAKASAERFKRDSQMFLDLLGMLKDAGVSVLPRWHRVLGMGDPFTLEEAERAYREKMRKAHPDMGGSVAAAAELNAAVEEARTFFAQHGEKRR